ncbi:MAG: methionyl-tRNA formyltransferase [bacterium]|nr:methionyl-tRNA formyltransferase [bacterium]
MKYAFFGTPDFAAVILEKLIKSGFPPAAVVCNHDRPVGRKKIITPPPTKVLAEKYEIKVYQPEKLEIRNFQLEIGEIDFAVVAAYAQIIPKEILEMSRLGTIGVHPSLLPKYRGSSPIQSAILSGESETGVTLFLVDEKVDHGPIFAQRKLEFSISNFQFSKLQQLLAELAGYLLIETLPKFLKSEITPLPQDESQATYTKKFKTEDGYVDLEKDDPIIIERKICALNPEPGVWTILIPEELSSLIRANSSIQNKKRVKLLEAELVDGKLKLTKIQFEGGKPQIIP